MTLIRFNKTVDLTALVERDGYFVLPDFYDPKTIAELKLQLGQLLDADEAKRDANKQPINIEEDGIRSDYTEFMHNLLFPSFLNPLFAEVVVATLAFPAVSDMMQRVAGPNYRLRADLVRRSTGKDDTLDPVQLPHAWHRDSPGEFTFGFFLDDCSEPDSGGTAVVPGTHWSRHDPLWSFMLGPRSYTTPHEHARGNYSPIPEEKRLSGQKNLALRSRIGNAAIEIRGKPGDLFFFLNDTFHGRWPNRSAKPLMLVRFGGISSAFPFKADLPLPQLHHDSGDAIARLFGPQRTVTPSPEILLCRIRNGPRIDPLEEEAAAEKRQLLAELLESRPALQEAASPVRSVPNFLGKAAARLGRARKRLF